ncbi:MAG: DUF1993 domain-containing protein [Candidatus Kaiserbacteria bacterium]|nr:MAG: DUF1993 domain-containing protein [Candidatus Kaiserbacteria bacterium]
MQEANLYTMTIVPMRKTLETFVRILEKAQAHAAAHATKHRPASYFENALLHDSIIFDQFPFVMQIQRISDNAKNGAARLAGIEAPSFEDSEKTFDELKTRLQMTVAYLDTIKEADVAGHEGRKVVLPYWDGKHVTAFEYATEYLLPNFYFHAVTAYSILRKNGVKIGKDDYIGGLPLKA